MTPEATLFWGGKRGVPTIWHGADGPGLSSEALGWCLPLQANSKAFVDFLQALSGWLCSWKQGVQGLSPVKHQHTGSPPAVPQMPRSPLGIQRKRLRGQHRASRRESSTWSNAVLLPDEGWFGNNTINEFTSNGTSHSWTPPDVFRRCPRWLGKEMQVQLCSMSSEQIFEMRNNQCSDLLIFLSLCRNAWKLVLHENRHF